MKEINAVTFSASMDISPDFTFRSRRAGIQGPSAIWLQNILDSNTVAEDAGRFGISLRVFSVEGAVRHWALAGIRRSFGTA